MAQGYERKDNKPKMCFKGDWTKDHHMKDLLLTFVLLSSFAISVLFFQLGFILSLFFLFLVLVLSCLCFSCVCTFSLSSGWVQYFSSEHRNLIVYDFERTLLVFASSVEGDPWSRLMKEIIRLKRGQLVDNFIIVKG